MKKRHFIDLPDNQGYLERNPDPEAPGAETWLWHRRHQPVEACIDNSRSNFCVYVANQSQAWYLNVGQETWAKTEPEMYDEINGHTGEMLSIKIDRASEGFADHADHWSDQADYQRSEMCRFGVQWDPSIRL